MHAQIVGPVGGLLENVLLLARCKAPLLHCRPVQWVTPEIDIAFVVGSFGASGERCLVCSVGAACQCSPATWPVDGSSGRLLLPD